MDHKAGGLFDLGGTSVENGGVGEKFYRYFADKDEMAEQQIRSFRTDESVFLEGDKGDCAYLVESGRLLIYVIKGGVEVPLRILGEGEVLGEMALIDDSPRSASCRALCDGRLVVVTKDQLLARVRAADPVVRLLMQVLLERLRSQTDVLRGGISMAKAESVDPLAIEKKKALDRIGLENRLARAIEGDEFVPFYQPIYDLKTGEMRGCEALIRWFTKEDGMISPAVFMDVMEETSLIVKAGELFIEKSLADLAALRAGFCKRDDFFLSVNISGRQFAELGFVEHLESCRKQHKLPTQQIKLELTERIMMEGPLALSTLQECRRLGYQIAIDDFGTGFSSLQYLAQMPLTDLKIDRSFVVRMLDDDRSLLIVKSLVEMARVLGMKVIAEGIESSEQAQSLKDLHVEMGQGYHFSKPLPLADFRKLSIRK